MFKPADVVAERAAWAEHFRLIGEGEGLVSDRVWDNHPLIFSNGMRFGVMLRHRTNYMQL